MKNYTDLEQSKILAEILSIENADMHYVLIDTDEDKYDVGLGKYIGILPHYPCWSLAALLDALKLFTTPTAFSVKVCVPLLTKTNNGYSLTYTGDYTLYNKNNLDIAAPIETIADNPVDACVEMSIKLNELKML